MGHTNVDVWGALVARMIFSSVNGFAMSAFPAARMMVHSICAVALVSRFPEEVFSPLSSSSSSWVLSEFSTGVTLLFA
jgi:hypothetical protein